MQLAGSNVVQILDIKNEEDWRGPIETLFEKFSSYVEYRKDYVELIPEEMMITDWTGWTLINSIKRYITDDIEWKKLSIQKHSVICTNKSTILEWQGSLTKRVFHGGSAWNYECVSFQNIHPNSIGRVLDLSVDSGSSFFDKYIVEPTDYDKPVYYEIYTRSKFYNVNRILDASLYPGCVGWK